MKAPPKSTNKKKPSSKKAPATKAAKKAPAAKVAKKAPAAKVAKKAPGKKAAKKASVTKASAKKASAKKAPAMTASAKKASAKKAPATKASAKKAANKPQAKSVSAPERKPAPRADYGQPIDEFFTKQPEQMRPILEKLRELVEAAAPDAASSLKWGMPTFTLNGEMMCVLGGHKSHVNLVLAGPPETFPDPEGRLEGEAKGGRRLKLTKVEDLPVPQVRAWLEAAAARLR